MKFTCRNLDTQIIKHEALIKQGYIFAKVFTAILQYMQTI